MGLPGMRLVDRRPGAGWGDPCPGGYARRYIVAPADPAHLDAQQAVVGLVRRRRRGLRESTTCVARAAPGDCQMSMVLHGFRYSVYVRIARIALAEKELTYENVEIDPFATDVPIEYLTLHPFKRVPVLVDSDFALYETEAITRYIDEAFPGPALQPSEPRQRARMAQIISIIDSYGYVPMVRQVAGERVFALLGVGSLTKREFARVLRLPFASLPRSKRSFPAMGLLPGERCGPWPIFT